MKSQRLINRIVFVRAGMTIAVSATVPLMISSRAAERQCAIALPRVVPPASQAHEAKPPLTRHNLGASQRGRSSRQGAEA